MTLREMLERAPAAFVLISLASIISSAVFDLGYFSVLGMKYIYFMSAYDHLNFVLAWIPLVFSFCGVLVSIYMLSEYLVTTESPEDEPFGAFILRVIKSLFSLKNIVILLSMGVFLIVFSFFLLSTFNVGIVPDQGVLKYVLGSFIFLALATRKFFVEIFLVRIGKGASALFGVGLVGSALFFAGVAAAETHMSDRAPLYKITLDDGSFRELPILRTYSEGIFCFDRDTSTVILIKSRHVASVEHIRQERAVRFLNIR